MKFAVSAALCLCASLVSLNSTIVLKLLAYVLARWEVDDDLDGTVSAVAEEFEGFLQAVERIGVSDDRRYVDSTFLKPTHGQREVAAEVWIDGCVYCDVLEEQVSPS